MALTSRVKVKRALGIPSAVTEHDDFIDDLLGVADREIIAFCGMSGITQTTETDEMYDIPTPYETAFTLRNFPVVSVASVVSAGSTLSADSWYVDPRSGTIRLSDASKFFPEGRQKVAVTYTWGNGSEASSDVPDDLSFAATLICAAHFNRARHSGMVGEGMGSYRYTIDKTAIPATASAILANYRRLFPKESI